MQPFLHNLHGLDASMYHPAWRGIRRSGGVPNSTPNACLSLASEVVGTHSRECSTLTSDNKIEIGAAKAGSETEERERRKVERYGIVEN